MEHVKNLTKNITDKCSITIAKKSNECAICKNGYYMTNLNYKKCILNCYKCYNNKQFITCVDNYFLLSDSSKCISYDELNNCEDKTMKGCNKCLEGYYINNQYCSKCSFWY